MNKTMVKTRHAFGLALRIIITIGIIALIIWKFNFLRNIDIREIIDDSVSMPVTVLTLLGVYLLKGITFVVPASLIYTAIGMSLNTWLALAINTAGIMLEITVTYVLGLILGGAYVTKKIKSNKKGAKILNLYDKYENKGVFLIRILFFPIDICSLFFGSMRTPFGKYFLYSLLGIMPRVILFTILGDKVYDLIPMRYLIPVAAVIVGVALIVWTISYAVKTSKSEELIGKSPYTPLCDEKRSVILDTDISSDCDDAGAIAIMMQYIKKYQVNLLGICNCTSNAYGNGAIRAICEHYGLSEPVMGRAEVKPSEAFNSKYNKEITHKYCKYENSACAAMSDTDFYNKLLSDVPDNSVTIITIGMLTDISAALNRDALLFNKKVNSIIAMAGKFPTGKEFNAETDPFALKNVLEKFRNLMVFSGHEVGKDIKTGFDAEFENNPVFDCYKLQCTGELPYLNSSYDLTAIQYAFEGEGTFYQISKPVNISVSTDGSIKSVKDKNSNRYYIIKQGTDSELEKELNELLRKEP